MFRRLSLSLGCCMALSGVACAAVDVNVAGEGRLMSVKGLGASLARAIVAERTRQGPFRDAQDLATRVRGLGPKSVARLQHEGLEIAMKPPASLARRDQRATAPAPRWTPMPASAAPG